MVNTRRALDDIDSHTNDENTHINYTNVRMCNEQLLGCCMAPKRLQSSQPRARSDPQIMKTRTLQGRDDDQVRARTNFTSYQHVMHAMVMYGVNAQGPPSSGRNLRSAAQRLRSRPIIIDDEDEEPLEDVSNSDDSDDSSDHAPTKVCICYAVVHVYPTLHPVQRKRHGFTTRHASVWTVPTR